MIFRKKIQKSCAYCTFGVKLDDEQILCSKRGAMPMEGKCRKFEYDPCKRVPPRPKPLDFEKYDSEDFSL